ARVRDLSRTRAACAPRIEEAMRTVILLLLAGLLLATLVVNANADGHPPKRKRATRPSAAAPPTEEMMNILRQTREAAEAARDEARRAREQSEALRQRLEQTTADCGLRIAELKNEIIRLQTEIGVIARSKPTMSNAPENPQSAIHNPQSEERLASLEEQVEINAAQLKEHAQTKVESDSRFRMRLTGAILFNTYLNSSDSANSDVPIFAFPNSVVTGQKRNNLGATLRQTKIGLAMTGPRIGNARLSAEAEFDFWGGTTSRFDGDVNGILRIRTASARLDWEQTSIEIGQTAPIISPLNPNSLAAVWYPSMASSGNLWQWRPQITIEHRARLGDSSDLILQGGLMPNFNELFRGDTLEGDPGYEGRIAFRRRLDDERRIEVGFGGYAERRHFGFGKTVNSFAYTADWNLPLSSRVTLNGEAYYGRSINIAETGGGRIDRLYALSAPVVAQATIVRGIRSTGGWAQLTIAARRDLDFNFAFGKDDPHNDDVRFGSIGNFTRFKNQAASANFIHQLTQNFQVSLEYRRHWTDYAPGRRTNNHYNLAFGYLF
ncbi:MAG: hypothetical protein ACREEM_23125, partial [Blastocatellia bacterium]